MIWDTETNTLKFASKDEAEKFHAELSILLRGAMVQATRLTEDAQKAKELSRLVMQDNAAVMRALNAMRTGLERHGR